MILLHNPSGFGCCFLGLSFGSGRKENGVFLLFELAVSCLKIVSKSCFLS